MQPTFILDLLYLIAAITFVVGLKRLSHPDTARSGNQLAAIGMALAVMGTLFLHPSADRDLGSAVWETPNAESFRAAWEQFRPHLQTFEETLAIAASDVATNHNNNAVVNGVTDAPNLSPVSPI